MFCNQSIVKMCISNPSQEFNKHLCFHQVKVVDHEELRDRKISGVEGKDKWGKMIHVKVGCTEHLEGSNLMRCNFSFVTL